MSQQYEPTVSASPYYPYNVIPPSPPKRKRWLNVVFVILIFLGGGISGYAAKAFVESTSQYTLTCYQASTYELICTPNFTVPQMP